MNKIIIRKNGGFYTVYGEDCYILNYLFNYKIMDDKVGFPLTAINKVINELENCKISFEIINGETVDFKRKNNYKKYIDIGKKKHSLNFRIEEIIKKINKLNEEEIESIITFIEELL